MKLTYLDSALEDLEWVRTYYERVFPEGAYAAAEHFRETESLLLAHPFSGPPDGPSGLRKKRVTDTPFNLIYRVSEDEVEIIRVRDSRSG